MKYEWEFLYWLEKPSCWLVGGAVALSVIVHAHCPAFCFLPSLFAFDLMTDCSGVRRILGQGTTTTAFLSEPDVSVFVGRFWVPKPSG